MLYFKRNISISSVVKLSWIFGHFFKFQDAENFFTNKYNTELDVHSNLEIHPNHDGNVIEISDLVVVSAIVKNFFIYI